MGEPTNVEASGATGADESKKATTPAAPVPAPTPPAEEPRILEEHIVAPPPAKPIPPPPVTPEVAPVQPIFAPEDVQIEKVDLSKPVQPKVTEKPAAAPRKPIADVDKAVNTDLAQILQNVKLPEQKIAPSPVRSYDTSLASNAEKAAADDRERKARVRDAAKAVTESLPSTLPKDDDVRALHTLKDDLQTVVRDKKMSLVKAVTLEEEKKYRPRITDQEETAALARPRRTSLRFAITLILFFIGAGALGGTYYILNSRAPAEAPVTSQILFAEQVAPFPIDGLSPQDVRREIANARNAGMLTLGAIFQIAPVRGSADAQAPVTFGEFIAAIGARPPEELVRALSDTFFFGIHTVDENAPVFVIPVVSYERAFAAMLEWEKTMNADLAPIVSPVSMQTVSPEGVIVERVFDDTIIRNYDVRALRDESGTIQLYYSFPTRNILIIAESQYSFAELLSRLRADRRL